jgi:uncharacterized protein YraI
MRDITKWLLMVVAFISIGGTGLLMSVQAQTGDPRDPDGAVPVPTVAPGGALFPTATPFFPAPQLATDKTLAVVVIPRLNVRSAPNTDTAQVLTVITRGESFPIVDGLPDESWYLLDLGNGRGWVFGAYVAAVNSDDIDFDALENPTDEQLEALNEQLALLDGTIGVEATLTIRSRPTRASASLGRIPFGGRAAPIGRNEFGTWVQVNYAGTVGWVSIFYIAPPDDFNVFELPVTG